MRLSIPARVILGQLAVGVVGAGVWWGTVGIRLAIAALVGGVIGAISSAYLALRIRVAATKQGVPDALAGFIWGWLVKVCLALGLLYVAARLAPDTLPALLSTFGAAMFVYLFALRWSD